MATDVDVQFFSHLNGLTLGNNWGDLIRLLDTCLVNGLPLTSITSASIDAQGDITLNLYAAHNCMLFQIIELTGFAPAGFNGKYRVKGTPSATTLVLKAEKTGQTITTTGTAKLASLGYEIKYRDLNDVKRAYRAIDPTSAHPFIRVDESLSGEGGGTYTSTYAKYAMFGLIENMTHIDDYLDPAKLQLPLDTADFAKNWKITGTGSAVVRGWSRWYWNRNIGYNTNNTSDQSSAGRSTNFTLVGDKSAFYFIRNLGSEIAGSKVMSGCGLYRSSLGVEIIPAWFLAAAMSSYNAGTAYQMTINIEGGTPLANPNYPICSNLFFPKYSVLNRTINHVSGQGIVPDYNSGHSNYAAAGNLSPLEIPLKDDDKYLRGTLSHILYAGKNHSLFTTTPMLAESSMYVSDAVNIGNNTSLIGGFYFYLGEIE